MGWLMDPIYNAISWILLRWHWVWDAILPDGRFLGTTWDGVRAIVVDKSRVSAIWYHSSAPPPARSPPGGHAWIAPGARGPPRSSSPSF